MGLGARPLAIGSVALVGASLIAATPSLVGPRDYEYRMSDQQVELTGFADIGTNIFRIIADMPKNQLSGLQAATASLELSGNWWLYTSTNALGWDQADWAKAVGFTQMFTPIPEVAAAQAEQLNAIMIRNFPMTKSCTGAPQPCGDPFYFLNYFTTPPWEAIFGYSTTYGDVYNTIDPTIKMPWSGQTITYDPWGPAKALWEALTKDPDPNWTYERPYLLDQMEASNAFWKSVFNSFNPFVEGTFCLPCQLLGVKGAPSSLPVVQLFGNYYTYLDFGQEFTDQDFVLPHPELPQPAAVQTLSLWTPEAWQRLGRDANLFFKWIFGQGAGPVTEFKDPSGVIPAIPEPDPEIEKGLGADIAARVLMLRGAEIGSINNTLNGKVCDGSLGDCDYLDYPNLFQELSIQLGLQKLTETLADPEGGPTTVFGYSEGAVVATRWLNNYAKQVAAGNTDVEEASPDPEDLHFILTGNPDRKYGGTRSAWYIERPTTSDTKYTVLDVAREYDGAADWPDDTFNLLAVANAISGYITLHLYYDQVDLDDADKTVFQEGNTTYVLSHTKNLPMLEWMRTLGMNKLADSFQSWMKPIIDSAYKREYPNVITDPTEAQDAVDRAKEGLPPLDYPSSSGDSSTLRTTAVSNEQKSGATDEEQQAADKAAAEKEAAEKAAAEKAAAEKAAAEKEAAEKAAAEKEAAEKEAAEKEAAEKEAAEKEAAEKKAAAEKEAAEKEAAEKEAAEKKAAEKEASDKDAANDDGGSKKDNTDTGSKAA